MDGFALPTGLALAAAKGWLPMGTRLPIALPESRGFAATSWAVCAALIFLLAGCGAGSEPIREIVLDPLDFCGGQDRALTLGSLHRSERPVGPVALEVRLTVRRPGYDPPLSRRGGENTRNRGHEANNQ